MVRGGLRMAPHRSLGREFGWLWAAYAVSAYGSGFGFGAFPLIAILVLHAGPAGVSALPRPDSRPEPWSLCRSGRGWSSAANAR
jgi:hypothetical protein